MNDKALKEIIITNVTTFFFFWIIIFFAGADKPPPIGFLWIVLLVALLDVAQFFYLKRFLPKLHQKTKGLFFINLLYFLIGGIFVSILTILIRPNLLSIGFLNTLFWVASIIIASLINAVCFYIFNKILFTIFQKRIERSTL